MFSELVVFNNSSDYREGTNADTAASGLIDRFSRRSFGGNLNIREELFEVGIREHHSRMIRVSFPNGCSSGNVVFLLRKVLSSISVFDIGSLTPFISGNFTGVLRNINQAVVVHDGPFFAEYDIILKLYHRKEKHINASKDVLKIQYFCGFRSLS
uniref:hypothetical protein n=1 Tax=Lactobacillus delbrueckii TaxID=1584 RepID=UPI0021A32D0B|nr:hypothetical protein [Lactobacillus delbrueckii]